MAWRPRASGKTVIQGMFGRLAAYVGQDGL